MAVSSKNLVVGGLYVKTSTKETLVFIGSQGKIYRFIDQSTLVNWSLLEEELAYLHPYVEPRYPLPDDLYDSKCWKDGTYNERVEWLHVMYESKKQELETFLAAREAESAREAYDEKLAQRYYKEDGH